MTRVSFFPRVTVHSLHCAARHVSRRTVGARARHRLSKSVLSTARPARAQARRCSLTCTLTCTVGHTPRWVPAVPSCKRNLFRCDSQSIIISRARRARSACSLLPGAAAARGPRRPPDAPGLDPFAFQGPFHLTGLQGDKARTHCIEAVVCGVKAQAHRACGHGPHTPHKNLVTPRRAPAAHSSHFRPARTAARTCTQVRVCSWPWPISHKPALHARMPALGLQASLLASATPQGAAAAALAASLSLF